MVCAVGREDSCNHLVLPQFCFHNQVHFFNTCLPLISLPIMRRVTTSWSGRRHCAWTWLLQRNCIHDIFNLLKDGVALGLGPCYGAAATWHCCSVYHHSWRSEQGEHAYKTGFLYVSVSPRWDDGAVLGSLRWGSLGYYDAFATNGRAALRVRVAAPPGRHRPGLLRCRRAARTSLLQVQVV